MSHLLIDKAFKYDIPNQKETLDIDYHYDEEKGYWLNNYDGKPLMHENTRFKPRTKKDDIETGEDRKGE